MTAPIISSSSDGPPGSDVALHRSRAVSRQNARVRANDIHPEPDAARVRHGRNFFHQLLQQPACRQTLTYSADGGVCHSANTTDGIDENQFLPKSQGLSFAGRATSTIARAGDEA
jgi:hypothetical protein